MNIGMLGFGHVGRATAEVLNENAGEILRRQGIALSLRAVATRTPAKTEGLVPPNCQVTDRLEDVTDAPDIDVVVELMGGIEPALALLLRAIDQGKHVVTANKALLATHGDLIFARARQAGVIVAYEAAVAVAIPIIKLLREAQTANRIDTVMGIVNGTSNFILGHMGERASTFRDALAQAQRLGYAESDPTLDIDGGDAAHKLTILAALAFGTHLQLSAVHTKGIADLDPRDMRHALSLGYTIKLLAAAKRHPHGFELRVEPTLIPKDDLLANVSGPFNAILIDGNVSGTTVHQGAGAGGRPTASAVIADLLDIARLHGADPDHHIPLSAFQPDHIEQPHYLDPAELDSAYYVRLQVPDEIGALATITAALAQEALSIETVWQERPAGGAPGEVIFITHPGPLVRLQRALEHTHRAGAIGADRAVIRVEHPPGSKQTYPSVRAR